MYVCTKTPKVVRNIVYLISCNCSNRNYIFCNATVRLPAWRRAAGTEAGVSRRLAHKGTASWEPDRPTSERKDTPCRYRRCTEGANGQGGVDGGKSTIRSPPLPGRLWRTGNVSHGQPKSAAKSLKISQVQSKTSKFRVGQLNQAEGRGMSEAVTVEDKSNQYNANVTGRQKTVVAGLSRLTHHHGAGE